MLLSPPSARGPSPIEGRKLLLGRYIHAILVRLGRSSSSSSTAQGVASGIMQDGAKDGPGRFVMACLLFCLRACHSSPLQTITSPLGCSHHKWSQNKKQQGELDTKYEQVVILDQSTSSLLCRSTFRAGVSACVAETDPHPSIYIILIKQSKENKPQSVIFFLLVSLFFFSFFQVAKERRLQCSCVWRTEKSMRQRGREPLPVH